MTKTEHLVSLLKEQIRTGEYQPGQRLPSEREIADHFGLSRMTVRHALQKLQATGIIRIVPNSGAFVQSSNEQIVTSMIQTMPLQWEYCHVKIMNQEMAEVVLYKASTHAFYSVNNTPLEMTIEKLGIQGWEAFSIVTDNNGGMTWFFKRPVHLETIS